MTGDAFDANRRGERRGGDLGEVVFRIETLLKPGHLADLDRVDAQLDVGPIVVVKDANRVIPGRRRRGKQRDGAGAAIDTGHQVTADAAAVDGEFQPKVFGRTGRTGGTSCERDLKNARVASGYSKR